ncbi:c2 domain-containing protein [Coniochaeta sp. 2T2.1]|nr:c2 domain-containing protein [Coniochaeta sp. 2T2.1]
MQRLPSLSINKYQAHQARSRNTDGAGPIRRRAAQIDVQWADAYTYALRVAYLNYLLQPRKKRKEYVAQPKPQLARSNTLGMLGEVFGVGDVHTPSMKLPSGYRAQLEKRITNIIMGKETMAGYNDPVLKRTFAEAYTTFSEQNFRRSVDKDRKVEPLFLMFYSAATKALKQGKDPTDKSWTFMVDRHTAMFLRLMISVLRDHGADRDRPELIQRLTTLESKLLTSDQNLLDTGQGENKFIEVEIPLTYEVKDMHMVLVVAKIFGVSPTKAQADIDANKATWTEEAAVRDLKQYQTRLSSNMAGTLSRDDFDLDLAYDEWKKNESHLLGQIFTEILSVRPELRGTSSSSMDKPLPTRPQSMFLREQAYADLGKMLAEPDVGGHGFDQPSLAGLSLEDSTIRSVDEPNYTFIPPEPRAFYKKILYFTILYESFNQDPTEPFLPLGEQTNEVMIELSVRWRLPQSTRYVIFTEVAVQMFRDQELTIGQLDYALEWLKSPPHEPKKIPPVQSFMAALPDLDPSRWTIHDIAAYRHALGDAHTVLLRDLYEALERCYEPKPPSIKDHMMVLGRHVYDDPSFSQRPEDSENFKHELGNALRDRAATVYRDFVDSIIPQNQEEWDFSHVVQLGKAVTSICQRIKKRYKSNPEILGDANEFISRVLLVANERGVPVNKNDGFELYKELVEIRATHLSDPKLKGKPFAFHIENLLEDFDHTSIVDVFTLFSQTKALAKSFAAGTAQEAVGSTKTTQERFMQYARDALVTKERIEPFHFYPESFNEMNRPSKYIFTIKVVEGEDLKACDPNGYSDPYVSFDITVSGPLNIIATIWDWDRMGDHDFVGRTSLKLDPGRLLIKRTERDMVRKITDKLTTHINASLSRQALKSLVGGTLAASVTSLWKKRQSSIPPATNPAAVEQSLHSLFEYFQDNFSIMNITLRHDTMLAVMARLWKEVLLTIENLLVPPLSEQPSTQKPLTQAEMDVVYKWLDLLFEFFNDQGQGVPKETLLSPKFLELKSLNYFYNMPTEDLIRTSETIAANNAQKVQQQLMANSNNRLSAPAALGGGPASYSALGIGSLGTIRRGRSIMTSRNLGTMRKAKEEKRKEAREDASDDMILRILRMRPEAARYLLERQRQKTRQESQAAAQAIVRQSAQQGWNSGQPAFGGALIPRGRGPCPHSQSRSFKLASPPTATRAAKPTTAKMSSSSPYTLRKVAAPHTLEHRVYIEKDGVPISAFHDIPLYANAEQTVLNMIVEIPRWTNAKLEISKDELLNPIKQDIKKGKLRFVRNCFPHKGYLWNYGAFPQTWEDPNVVHPETKAKGDNDPLDVCEIGELVGYTGQVKQVKVLGVMALLDEEETDWKVIVIDVNDPLAPKLNDVEDVERHLPGLLRATNEWFRIYKIPDGKPENQFAFTGECKNKKYAMDVVRECAEAWEKLITGKTQPGGISTTNLTVSHSPSRVSPDQLPPLPPNQELAPEKIDSSIDKWFFISGASA